MAAQAEELAGLRLASTPQVAHLPVRQPAVAVLEAAAVVRSPLPRRPVVGQVGPPAAPTKDAAARPSNPQLAVDERRAKLRAVARPIIDAPDVPG